VANLPYQLAFASAPSVRHRAVHTGLCWELDQLSSESHERAIELKWALIGCFCSVGRKADAQHGKLPGVYKRPQHIYNIPGSSPLTKPYNFYPPPLTSMKASFTILLLTLLAGTFAAPIKFEGKFMTKTVIPFETNLIGRTISIRPSTVQGPGIGTGLSSPFLRMTFAYRGIITGTSEPPSLHCHQRVMRSIAMILWYFRVHNRCL
jgi:hypothetical protein